MHDGLRKLYKDDMVQFPGRRSLTFRSVDLHGRVLLA